MHICVSHVPLVTTHKCASRPDSCTAGFVIRVDVNYLPAVFALCVCLCVEIIVVVLTLVVMHTPLQHTNHSKAAFKQDMSFCQVSFHVSFPFKSPVVSLHVSCPATWADISVALFREQLSRLSVHVEIASKINQIIDAKDLTDLGKLEQDLVFGDATSKEIITYISTNQKMSAEDKVIHHCSVIMIGHIVSKPQQAATILHGGKPRLL